MPTYDYQCRSCGHTVEVIHSMTEEGPRTCERCGGELRRVLYPTGIIFKGSGFYKTDSRASATGASAAKPSSEKSTAPKTDTGGSAADAGSVAPSTTTVKKESASS